MQNRWAMGVVSGVMCAGLLLALSTTLSTQGTIYFRSDFENLGPSGAQYYNFASKFGMGQWTLTHLPSGGWNGSGGAQVRMHAGQTQYQFGFVTPGLNRSFTMGDAVYFRWRMRFLPEMRVNQAWGNKFIMFGSTSVTPQSRFIMYMSPQHDSRGCTLDFAYPSQPWSFPNFYGLNVSPNSFRDGVQNGVRLYNHAWSLEPSVNIGWECGPPVFLTEPGSPFAYGRPAGSTSATPGNGWYHFQVYVKSGQGNAEFKTWTNNNSFTAPSGQAGGMTLGVTGWSNGAHIGGYMDNDTPSNDLGYVIDDFEIGSAFDPSWYPGGGGSTTTPPPPPPPGSPTNVRVIR